jgi:hypothetical protein
MIREFDAETGSRQTASSAKQSAIFAFPAENSKIVRMCAHFLLLRGTGEGQIRAAITFLAGLSIFEDEANGFSGRKLASNALKAAARETLEEVGIKVGRLKFA